MIQVGGIKVNKLQIANAEKFEVVLVSRNLKSCQDAIRSPSAVQGIGYDTALIIFIIFFINNYSGNRGYNKFI